MGFDPPTWRARNTWALYPFRPNTRLRENSPKLPGAPPSLTRAADEAADGDDGRRGEVEEAPLFSLLRYPEIPFPLPSRGRTHHPLLLVVSGEEEERGERRRRDKKDSRRSSREDREEEDDRHKKRKKSKHSDRERDRDKCGGWVLPIVITTNQFWLFNTFCSMSASTSLRVIIAL